MPIGNFFDRLIEGVEPCSRIVNFIGQNNRDSTGAETEFTIARNHFDNEEYGNAFLHLKKALMYHSAYTNAYLYIVRIYLAKNMMTDARSLLQRLVNVIPNYQFYVELANLYQKNGLDKKIVDLWKKYIDKFPESEKGYLNLGNYYAANGQTAKAVTIFEKILLKCKNSNGVKEQISRIYIKNQEFDKAISLLKEIYDDSDKQSVKAEEAKQIMHLSLLTGAIETAFSYADEIAGVIRDQEGLLLLSDAMIASGRFDLAREFLVDIKKVNPFQSAIWYRYAFIYLAEKDILNLNIIQMALKEVLPARRHNLIPVNKKALQKGMELVNLTIN
ncbi:MAG: tetratricopeptide repeat protein [Candidatus Muiribacteriaceae bacterium]